LTLHHLRSDAAIARPDAAARAMGRSGGGWRAVHRGRRTAACASAHCARPAPAHLQRHPLGRGHRVARLAPSWRMNALVLDITPSLIAPPICPPAVAEAGGFVADHVGDPTAGIRLREVPAMVVGYWQRPIQERYPT